MPLSSRLAVLAAIVFAAPAAAKDTLTIGVAQFPANLHPYIGSQTVQQYVVGIGLHRLTALDFDGKVVCLLCTEVPSLENGGARVVDRQGGQKGLDVTFRLRPDLKWGDGAPVTSRDVAFTFKVGSDPNAGFANPHMWTRATSVDTPDEHTVVMHLPRTLTTFALWDEVLSEHIEGPVYAGATGPGEYVNRTVYNREPTNPGLWMGPFVVAEYHSNDHVLFRPNPYWPGPKPGLAAINVRLVENTAALQANLLSGDVDMTPSGIGLSIDQAAGLEKGPDGKRFQFFYRPGLTYEHIEPQWTNPVLADRRVREALRRAVDVKSIVDRLFAGHAEIARTFINGVDRHFTPDVPTYDYDPGRAKALLDEAGWVPGADGVRRKGDARLSFDFSTTSGNRVRELTQQVMQNQWKAVGVEVRITNQPSRTFFGQLLKQREFTGLVEFSSTGEPDLPAIRWTTPYIPTAANTYGGQNYSTVSNKEFDEAVEASLYELDPVSSRRFGRRRSGFMRRSCWGSRCISGWIRISCRCGWTITGRLGRKATRRTGRRSGRRSLDGLSVRVWASPAVRWAFPGLGGKRNPGGPPVPGSGGAVADEVVDHAGVGEGRGVAEAFGFVGGDLAQDAAHDLAGAGFR